MTNSNIKALLDRQYTLTTAIDRANALIATCEHHATRGLNTTAALSIAGSHGYIKINLGMTKHLASTALLDMHAEQDALTERLDAINTLLAD